MISVDTIARFKEGQDKKNITCGAYVMGFILLFLMSGAIADISDRLQHGAIAQLFLMRGRVER